MPFSQSHRVRAVVIDNIEHMTGRQANIRAPMPVKQAFDHIRVSRGAEASARLVGIMLADGDLTARYERQHWPATGRVVERGGKRAKSDATHLYYYLRWSFAPSTPETWRRLFSDRLHHLDTNPARAAIATR